MTTSTPLPLLPFKEDLLSRGFGVLEVRRGEERIQLPLARVDIRARVVDRFAQSTMTEVFRNTFTDPLEATYVFPLPGAAAVSNFELHVAGRVVRGVVEERSEARRQYAQALQEGKRAALLEKERDDVFTVQVGNLPPGEEVKVVLTWSERLPYFDDGTTELRLPLVVAPRYIPGGILDRESVGRGTEHDTDVVPDASRITPPRLAEGFDPGTGLSIEVELRDGGLEDIGCSQHATRVKLGDGAATVTLAQQGERLNRDFILRWRLAGEKIQTRMWTSGGYAALSIVPPRRDGFLGTPRDVVFVLDRSGSMQGAKMVSASRACAILLATLGPRDRFAIQIFDDIAEWYDPGTGTAGRSFASFSTADEAGVEKGEKFLRTVEARGGTELDQALSQALDHIAHRPDGNGRSPVIVLLTDGQIGDESRVLKRIQTELGDSRVFTVGIDTAVNESFLRRLASAAGGTSTFVTPGDALEEALRAVGREIGDPLVIDVHVDNAEDVAPATIPDLFAGRATVAWLRPKEVGPVRVRGRCADGSLFDETVQGTEVDLPAIPQLWARARIVDLEDRFRVEPQNQAALKAEIVAISRAHRVLTRFTAFVVVDDEVVNKDGDLRSVTQPVEMPAQWEMKMNQAQAFPAGAPRPAVRPAPSRNRAVARSRAKMEEARDDESLMCMEAAPPPPPACPPPPGASFAASPSPSGPAQRPKAKAGGTLGRVFGGLFEKVAGPTDKREEHKPEPSNDEPSKKAVVEAFQALVRAVRQALEDLRAGRRPDPTPLEQARKQLLNALSSSTLGPDLALAQRFVRQAAVEMVAALHTPDAQTAALLPLFERHAKALEEARAEASAVIGRSDAGFWESTV